jgi:glycosyltransferase involved in cell wall biosynthesis
MTRTRIREHGMIRATARAHSAGMATQAPIFDQPTAAAAAAITLSVCICTHERPGYLNACLESLKVQSIGLERFEVIVVDSASSPAASARLREVVDGMPNALMIRVEEAGASLARNRGIEACTGSHIAFLDDDAVAAPDWLERILEVLTESRHPPAVIGGRVLPRWEAPLPAWWPQRLRGVLSIIEFEGSGEYRTAALPRTLEPYSVNMVVNRAAVVAVGSFDAQLGRVGTRLLSDEDVHLAWKLQDAGYSARYDSRIVVFHQIQAPRLRPEWLLDRLYWQGASTVLTRKLLRQSNHPRLELMRRLAVEALCAPAALLPGNSTWLLGMRWRHAYACGFTRMALADMDRKRAVLLRRVRRLWREGGSAVQAGRAALDHGAAEVQPAPKPEASA